MRAHILFASLACLTLQANPIDPTVVVGDVTFAADASAVLEITTSDKAVIEWKEFSIGEKELTRFIQPATSSMVLNRVTTGAPSELLGRLEANGQLFLVNPNGIFIGESAVIDTNSFFAFTFDIGNDFSYTVPEVQQTSFDVAIHHKGRIDALGSKEEGGQVFLIAPQGLVEVEGTIDVSGNVSGQPAGSIEISAKQVYVAKESVLKADASEVGDGGSIDLWGDDVCIFHGLASAKAGTSQGDGGIIEVSSPGYLDFHGSVSTDAPNGRSGTLLLDPSSIRISLFASSPLFTFPIYNPVIASANILVGDLIAALDTGVSGTNVTIRTSAGSGGTGNITVDPVAFSFFWSKPSTLTFEPNGDLIINDFIFAMAGNIVVNAGGNLILNDVINAFSGNITVNAGGTVQAIAGIVNAGLSVDTGTMTVNAVNLLFQGGTAPLVSGGLFSTGAGTIIANISNNVTLIAGTGDDFSDGTIDVGGGTIMLNVGRDLNQIVPALPALTKGRARISNGFPSSTTINVAGDHNLISFSSFSGVGGNKASVSAEKLNLDVRGNLTLTTLPAGPDSVGIAAITSATINVRGDLTLNNHPSIGGGSSLTLTCDNNVSILGGTAIIAGGDMIFNCGRNLLVTSIGPSGGISGGGLFSTINVGGDFSAFGTSVIEKGASASSGTPFDIFVGGNFSLNDTSYVVNHNMTGPIQIRAGNNMVIAGIMFGGTISSAFGGGSGTITLVADNAFPSPPGIGSGSFILAPGAFIATLGETRIFTARRDQNSVVGMINGLSFAPGPLFVNTTTEMWGIWFPHNSGLPFTIFYKDIDFPISIISDFNIPVFEYLQNLGWLNEFDFTKVPFDINRSAFDMLRPTVREPNRGKIVL